MNFTRFEDILAWQKAGTLTVEIYQIFKEHKDYGFKDQICRASVSIMNNIAEGFERQGNKEFSRFLYIAKGSCAEVRSMLYLGKKLEYINQKQFLHLKSTSTEISKILSGLIKAL